MKEEQPRTKTGVVLKGTVFSQGTSEDSNSTLLSKIWAF